MKLALYQGPPIQGDVEAGFSRIEAQLSAAARAGAAMAVFPELFIPGYNRPDLHGDLAQPLDGAWASRLGALAAKAGCGLTIGWAEREGNRVFNAATAFDAEGRQLAHYRKIQLWGPMEQESFQPGSAYSVFDLQGTKTAILICYDIEFSQHVRNLAEQGVKLILVPTANPAGWENVCTALVPAKAAEMGLTIAYANFCGEDAGLTFAGLSILVGPDAKPLATAGTGEALLVADLAPTLAIPPQFLSQQLADYREIEP